MMIHGKPNAGSFNATSKIQTFANQLDEEFFGSKDNFQGKNFLIVDARYWNGVWYSIYTYWVSNNIKGIDGRGSYFAISIIVPRRYYLLVSEVYKKLQFLYKKNVVGTYISTNGDYLVQNLSNNDHFNELYAAFGRNFANLEEDFDDKFKLPTQGGKAINYHPNDCDSLAFVDDLRFNGRVFVSELFETKDTRLGQVNKYKMELASSLDKAKKLEFEIRQLKEDKASLEKSLASNQKAGKDKLSELSNKNVALQKELSSYTERFANVQENLATLQDYLKGLASLLGTKQQVNGQVVKGKAKKKSTKSVWHFFSLSFLNTLLILAFGILLLTRFNGNIEGYTPDKVITDTNTNDSISTMPLDDNSDGSRGESSDVNDDTTVGTNASLIDENCDVELKEIDGSISKGDLKKPKKLTFAQQAGYDFYFDNVANENQVKSAISAGKEFLITKKDQNKSASITYRSADKSKLNEKNRVILN